MEQIRLDLAAWNKAESTLLKATGCAVFAFLTIISAQIKISLLPLTPVPMTLQTFIVPLAGGFLGAFWGGASMLLYLALGLIGLNVFAAASPGLSLFLAPSAGYIVGYVFAAVIVGLVHNRSTVSLFSGLILSNILILGFGVMGLMINAGMNPSEAFAKGVAPFLIGDSIKLAASFLVLLSYRQLKN